jgi:thiamine-phosphate pyrophosphorylase
MMVSDRRRLTGSPHFDHSTTRALAVAARRAARAGVDVIQIREKGLDAADLMAMAADVRSAINDTACRLVINERVDVAIAAGADGVHLPANGLPAARVRAITPPRSLVGRSVHSMQEAVDAERAGGCDYLIFGTVFESASKPSGHPVAGLAALADVCAAVRLPVLAIGGMSLERVAAVAEAGVAGVAAIGLFATDSGQELSDTVSRIRRMFAAAGSVPRDRQP